MKKCPVDFTPLSREKYEHTPIWTCSECMGSLISKNKLESIKRKQNTTKEELQKSVDHSQCQDTEKDLRCPDCKATMKKVSAFEKTLPGFRGEQEGFMIDVCSSCHQIWLDGGELLRLELDYQQSAKGKEFARTYKNYQVLTKEEKAEYIKNVADTHSSSGEQFFWSARAAFLDAIIAAGTRIGWFSPSNPHRRSRS